VIPVVPATASRSWQQVGRQRQRGRQRRTTEAAGQQRQHQCHEGRHRRRRGSLEKGLTTKNGSKDPKKNDKQDDQGDSGDGSASDCIKNGHDSLQIWALVLRPDTKEVTESERRVVFPRTRAWWATRRLQAADLLLASGRLLRLHEGWKDVECYDDDQRFASFQMSWRARLRRVYAPSFGNQLVGLATSALLSGGNISDFVAGQVSNNPQARKAADKVGKLRNSSLGSHATGTDLGNVPTTR